MATARPDVDLSLLTGQFNITDINCFNPFILGGILNSYEKTFNFCCEIGLIKNTRTCPRCRRELKLTHDRRSGHTNPVVFRCTNNNCKKQYISVHDGTFFEGTKLSAVQILVLVSVFCGGRAGNAPSYEDIRFHSQIGPTELSSETIADWLSFCREVCLETVSRETPTLIGGAGLTVEVDESKFGKRKYDKGRLVEGQWVVGGICRETKDIFLAVCPHNKRDAPTLLDIIERHVNKHSTIITDCWRAYDGLSDQGWQHLTVNHTYNFVGM